MSNNYYESPGANRRKAPITSYEASVRSLHPTHAPLLFPTTLPFGIGWAVRIARGALGAGTIDLKIKGVYLFPPCAALWSRERGIGSLQSRLPAPVSRAAAAAPYAFAIGPRLFLTPNSRHLPVPACAAGAQPLRWRVRIIQAERDRASERIAPRALKIVLPVLTACRCQSVTCQASSAESIARRRNCKIFFSTKRLPPLRFYSLLLAWADSVSIHA